MAITNKQFLDKDGVDYLAQGLKAKIPTKVSQLENDSQYKTTDTNTTYTITSGDANGQIKISPNDAAAYNVDIKGLKANAFTDTTIPTKTSDLTNDSNFIDSSYHDSTKQDTLVSGTNIKTINDESILGDGNIEIKSRDNVFLAKYGETTRQEIVDAYNEGKIVACNYGKRNYFLSNLSGKNSIPISTFTSLDWYNAYYLQIYDDNSWHFGVDDLVLYEDLFPIIDSYVDADYVKRFINKKYITSLIDDGSEVDY